MKTIQSTKNPYIKELKKLHKRKSRIEQKKYLLEGFHLIEEAVNNNQKIEAILLTNRGNALWRDWTKGLKDVELYLVNDEVMQLLSDLPSPQGILAVVAFSQLSQPEFTGGWLLLDNVQDPGNVGTMIRTADAAGLKGVLIGPGTADIYSTKVLRSMQGSNFHIPVIEYDLFEAIQQFKQKKIPVYGTELNQAAVSLPEVPITRDFALVMGNEGQGVQKVLLSAVDQSIYIPIYGAAESLNVGVAAGILMYHFVLRGY